MSRFIALPVGQGDAFFLEREAFHILVDGGKSKTAISSLVDKHCSIDGLDVLICTHNDADHANGVAGLIENWTFKIQEVWLPGSWTYRMEDVLRHPCEFSRELAENILKIFSLKNVKDFYSLESKAHGSEFQPNKASGAESFSLAEVVEHSKDLLDQASCACIVCPICEPIFSCKDSHFNSFYKIFLEAIDAANNIRKIVELAYRRGCLVRFFEFGTGSSGGIPGKLVPVNANEITSLSSYDIDALTYLGLTVANKESLVFFCPETSNEPSILFTADSDLDFPLLHMPQPAPRRNPIITSPHHGAEDNAMVYDKVSNWLGNAISPIWVRSDCKTKKRPGKTFMNQNNKYCTLCNCGTRPQQAVEFTSSAGNWQNAGAVQSCSCR